MTGPAVVSEAVKAWLREQGYTAGGVDGRGVTFTAAGGDCLVEVDPAGRLRCHFGVDLDELRDLIAGSSTEDLGSDELQRAARYHLQTLTHKYRPRLATAGFAETYEVTDDHAVISFTYPIDYSRPEQVIAVLARCVHSLA